MLFCFHVETDTVHMPDFRNHIFCARVSADGDNLILSSWFANEVQVWNPETGTVVEDYPDFAVPLNAIRFQGEIAVAELLSGSVVRASDGSPLARASSTKLEGNKEAIIKRR